MNLTDWAYLPPELTLTFTWTLLTAFRLYLAAWAVSYILSGGAAMAAVAYAAAGHWPNAAAAAGFLLATLFLRFLHGPSGPRRGGGRS